MTESLGILGGAFDPVHLGHLTIAQAAIEQFRLDQVLFVPTFAPANTHKIIPTAFDHRCAMIQLAIAEISKCALSTIESEIEPPTYTIKMLEKLKSIYPQSEFTFLMGADSLSQIESWHQPDKIYKLARFAVAARSGHPHQSHYPFVRIDMPEIDISATELRNSLRAGHSVRFLVPDAVIAYIESHQLYREE